MENNSEQLHRIEQEVINAFSCQPYPGDANIAGGDFGEYLDAKREVENIRWQDLSDDHISRLDWLLPFLSPLGFRYYLPAFLLYTLRHIKTSDMATDATLWNLQADELFSERVQLLNVSQQRAVKHFLEFMKEHGDEGCEEDAAEAINGYWSRVPEE